MQWGTFKPILADAIAAHLAPIQKKYAEVLADEVYLDQVITEFEF
jgi:tryptophanyl-tRNA synthetase